MKFRFVEVGRGNYTGEVDLSGVSDVGDSLISELYTRGRIMSRSLEVRFTEDGCKGSVVVGLVRPIGTIECLDDEAKEWARVCE